MLQSKPSMYGLERDCSICVGNTLEILQSSWHHQMETFSAVLAISAGNSPVPHKGQWRGALMFSLICDWINYCVNNRKAGDLRCYHAHYVVTVMLLQTINGWLSGKQPGPRFNIKMSSYQDRKSHCGDKTVVRSSYLHNGISDTGKMSSLYWIGALLSGHWVICNKTSSGWPKSSLCSILYSFLPWL